MKNRPAYAIESVDRALRLAALLQQEGSVRVTYAADVLGISASSAHRLLSMLVYRDFAEQLADRSYGPGPVLRATEHLGAPVQTLRDVARPHLRALVDRVAESANLLVRVGTETRFVSTVETDWALRVGDRAGRALPAHLTSGGRALLALLPPSELRALYANSGELDVDLDHLARRLTRVGADGYAINRGDTEDGVTAVGVASDGAGRHLQFALSVGLPTSRFSNDLVPSLVAALSRARADIEADLQSP